jgi:hypothetical protein
MKLCNPQYTNTKGIEELMQSFNGWPIEFPTFAACYQSDPDFIELPY